eukprot:352181-Chlamydomonas_euryale.AAC.1
MLFREALKSAAYDLGNARDTYRFATAGAEGMSRDVVLRYIEASAQLLAPIIPHTSDHIWVNVLKKDGSVLTAGWPKTETPDFVMQRASKYIEGACGKRCGVAWVCNERAAQGTCHCAAQGTCHCAASQSHWTGHTPHRLGTQTGHTDRAHAT